MKNYDFLVVGQGLAGTCLAITLQRAGKSVFVVDDEQATSSSRVAAGFLHPITGRRIVKTWMADQLFPFAASFYDDVEKEHGKRVLHLMDSLEVVTEVKALNEWNDRSAEPELSGYISTEETGSHAHALSDYLKLFRVNQGGWLDIPLFLDLYRSSWIKEGKMALLKTTDHPCREAISMKKTAGIEADRVVWCEGQSARKNPLWSWLPFDPVKGELLTLEIPDLPQTEIVVHGIFLIPLGDSLFRAGATYSWHELDHLPTDSAKQKLTDKLQRTLKVPFRIIGHQAGIRPAVKGRRPLLGRHPDHPDQWIFNGLGSKGSTLAPWFADHYKEHLLSGKPLMAEVDIRRFSEK